MYTLAILKGCRDINNWSEEQFQKVVAGLGPWAKEQAFTVSVRYKSVMLILYSVPIIPISAKKGDNVVETSSHGWKNGHPTLLQALDVALQG